MRRLERGRAAGPSASPWPGTRCGAGRACPRPGRCATRGDVHRGGGVLRAVVAGHHAHAVRQRRTRPPARAGARGAASGRPWLTSSKTLGAAPAEDTCATAEAACAANPRVAVRAAGPGGPCQHHECV